MSKYKTLSEITPRDPIGAAVSLGIKNDRGIPVDKDRFHIVMPHETDNRRSHHPAFAAFNRADMDKRRTIKGNIVSSNQEECFEYYRRAQIKDKKMGMHPKKLPFCQSDGVTATRWVGGDKFEELACLGKKCEFSCTLPPMCRPYMRLMFRLRWSEQASAVMPSLLVSFKSQSWETISSAAGMFAHATTAMNELGIEPNLFGLPFTMTLVERTNKEKRSRYPTVAFSIDCDIIQFAASRQETIERIGKQPLALPQAAETEYLEYESINMELPK